MGGVVASAPTGAHAAGRDSSLKKRKCQVYVELGLAKISNENISVAEDVMHPAFSIFLRTFSMRIEVFLSMTLRGLLHVLLCGFPLGV